MRRITIMVIGAVLASVPAQAQQEVEFHGPELVAGPWKLDNFPYFTVTPNDGFMVIGRVQYGQAADFLDRVSMARRIALEGGVSPSGSRFASLRFDAPRLADGWRVASELRIERANRMGYYGLGNSREEIAPGDDSPYVNRVRRNRAVARVEVTRALTGPISLAVAGGTGRTTWSALEGHSVFSDETGHSGGRIEEDDTWGRLALVVDLRDNEYEPKRGVLIEGGVFTGSGGDGYTGWYALFSGYAQPGFGTVLAAQLGGRSMSSEAPLTARYEIQTWEHEVSVLGGPGSHRALAIGRFVGHSVLFGSLELRQQIVDAGDFGGVYGLAFVDAGRVFESDLILDAPLPRQNFRLTTDGLKVGGGIGVGLRILRANVLNVSVARGPDGTKGMVGSGWSF